MFDGRASALIVIRRGLVPLLAAVLVAGCASADKSASTMSSTMSSSSSASAATAMAGMSMGLTADKDGGTVTSTKVAGLTVVPTTVLASTTWQGMRITAEARTPVPFVIYNGTSEQEVKPGPHSSFHFMVMLSDAHTGVAIPYAGVWATISKAGKVVYDERQWPMISRYMGPHYGNDVSLPGDGTYQLSLLVSPPVSARHMEYANVWQQPHRVNFTFHLRQS